MHHLAIMKKSWRLTPKILTGQKKIESRWYHTKYPPWDKIQKSDTVYFKDSGDPVRIKTTVERVLQFYNLNHSKVKEIMEKYGQMDGIAIPDIQKFYEQFKDKKYCILIFLKNPKKIEPFHINKTGYGMMSSWITLKDINQIKVGK